jgi:hypothetical protein
MHEQVRQVGTLARLREPCEPAAHCRKHCARRLPRGFVLTEIALDRHTRRQTGVPTPQRSQFIGARKSRCALCFDLWPILHRHSLSTRGRYRDKNSYRDSLQVRIGVRDSARLLHLHN